MKLFTIGDSISQGFMSGAAARTDLSYSTILAQIFKIKDYNYPHWPKGGHPINIEDIFRKLQRKLGSEIKGPIEWPIAINMINNYIDMVEDYYERGPGNFPISEKPFHNVSVRGFNVSASWQIKPKMCSSYIETSDGRNDNWWGMVDESFLRTARTVLSGGCSNGENFSQLDWLQHHHEKEGVENVILWLGANNALGTVLSLNINQTSNDGKLFQNGPESIDYETRRKNNWNLWHPEDFRVEYEFMLNKVVNIMENNPHNTDYKIFIGTVPLVTIAPLIKAVGEMKDREQIKVTEWPVNPEVPAPMSEDELAKSSDFEYSYSKYYPYFPFADNFKITDKHLNMQQALHIDNSIRKYNRIIQELVMQTNKKLNSRRFYLVDTASILNKMALKRNRLQPTYKYPDYFNYIYPRIDTRYYGVSRNGEIKSGGIFSLDGVHPSAIGQGIIAYEILKVMKMAGSYQGDPEKDINWNRIFKNDSLYNQPIGLLEEIYDNNNLAKWLIKMI